MEKIKNSRKLSFIFIAIIYAFATAVGVLTYIALNLALWLSLLIADVAATVAVFIFSLIFKNASVYDPYWSVQPIVILAGFAIAEGLNLFSALLLCVVSVWGVRLTANWAYTFGGLRYEDWRYVMLREKTGAFYPIINFVGIHLVPTLVVYGCTLPAVYAIVSPRSVNFLSVLFLVLSLLAVTVQGISDVQMHKYRKNRNTPFIRVGIWKNSRHPNYLGEIMMWWGVALAVFSTSPLELYVLSGAVANTILFLVVSIPLADTRQSKKAGFEEYKKETRMLLPIKKFTKKTNKVILIVAVSVLSVIVIGVSVCLGYLLDCHKADDRAIEAFAEQNEIRYETEGRYTYFEPEDSKVGFIFYPGAKVEHEAYIPLMQACASEGITCILVEMPLYFPLMWQDSADGVREKYPEIESWYIGGHSLGGYSASNYLKEHHTEYDGLILLASYSDADLKSTELDVLLVRGDRDKVMNNDRYKKGLKNLPVGYTELVIEGGCHAGFGMYNGQDRDVFSEDDNTMTNEQQIYITAKAISELVK